MKRILPHTYHSMKTLIAIFTVTVLQIGAGSANAAPQGVPTLDELAGDWMEVCTLLNLPSVNNFAGGMKVTDNLTAFTCLTIAPFAQGGAAADLLLDGKPVTAAESRWFPYEVRRRTTVAGVMMESAIRMPFEQKGVLTRLVLENKTNESRTFRFGMKQTVRVRRYAPEQWRTWGTPRPADNLAPAATAFAFVQQPEKWENDAAQWTVALEPGKRAVVEYVVAIGNDAGKASEWAKNFSVMFDTAKSRWEERWQAAFQPGNQHFSGHLPTLITDDPKIRRVYYEGALVPLLLCRTTYPYSQRCFVTAGPEWANTLVYFWDTEMWAGMWAMLEPVTMREQLIKWFTLDHHACYAVDCISGKGAGPWYAANDWSIFRCLEAYLDVTGDTGFLKAAAAGKTVLQRLDDLATAYEKRPLTKDSPLANYGGAQNLLECAPTYIEGVPSLNAANIYMLRHTAKFHEAVGNAARASELRAKSSKLLPAVLALYEPGQGVWSAVNRSGKRVPLRHCFDFIIVGQSLEHDLTPSVKSEMTAFVERELRTATWMRAMSLLDPAAAKSDRPDHGPLGSYDGWPPLTMDVMCRFGAFDKAVAFLRAVEPVTREGPFAQAHEFLDPDSRGKNPVVRIAHRGGQDFNEGCGAAFAEVIIRGVFGYRPDLSGDSLTLLMPKTPRGFNGELRHVPFHGATYTIKSDAQGIRKKEEYRTVHHEHPE